MRESASTYTVPVPQDKAGTRLDKLLAGALPALSRTRLKGLIEAGMVRAPPQGRLVDPAAKVKAGQTIIVTVPAPRPAVPAPQAMALSVVHEDDHVIVVDKPPGLVVHPAPGHADHTLVNALLAHCGGSLSGIGGVIRPGIVHRLDKDTSGLMVAAKSDVAHRVLADRFAGRGIERAYHAVVWGVPVERRGEITGNIGRSPANRKKMAVVRHGGKPARTRYRVIRALGPDASLVECRLETGRTHQIRVHMGTLGHPVIGDRLYGGGVRRRGGVTPASRAAAAALDRQALHAYLLGFDHPVSGRKLRFQSNLPSDIRRLIDSLDAV